MSDYRGNFYSTNGVNHVNKLDINNVKGGMYRVSAEDVTAGRVTIPTGVSMTNIDEENSTIIAQAFRAGVQVLCSLPEVDENGVITIETRGAFTLTENDRIRYIFLVSYL